MQEWATRLKLCFILRRRLGEQPGKEKEEGDGDGEVKDEEEEDGGAFMSDRRVVERGEVDLFQNAFTDQIMFT